MSCPFFYAQVNTEERMRSILWNWPPGAQVGEDGSSLLDLVKTAFYLTPGTEESEAESFFSTSL